MRDFTLAESKLEMLISGYRVNADDSAWLRSLISASPRAPASVAAPAGEPVKTIIRLVSEYAEACDDYAAVPLGEDPESPRNAAAHARAKAIYERIEAALAALAAPAGEPQPTDKPKLQTDRRVFLIHFDDADRRPEIWTDEAAARHRYADILMSWNAHLFVKVNSNSRDDPWATANEPIDTAAAPAGEPPVNVNQLTKERDGWKDEHGRISEQLSKAQAELAARRAEVAGSVWYWQDDGSDDPESLTCHVVMTAAQVRRLQSAEIKWQEYERNYILPCFQWAREIGFDLSKAVSENPGRNCVDLLVAELRSRAAPAPAGEPPDDTNALVLAAEKYAGVYYSDDRQGIVTDVLNAFYAGSDLRRKQTAAAPAGKPAADFKKSLGESVTPIGYARKQDLLIYSPAWMAYATKPAPENGYEPIALYTQDQVDALAAPAGELMLKAANLSAALRAIVRECREPSRTADPNSYLPPHLLDLAVAALESAETQEHETPLQVIEAMRCDERAPSYEELRERREKRL